MNRILAAGFAGAFLLLAASAAAHPGADQVSNLYLAHQHGRDALVVETNGLHTNGLQAYFGNQGGSDTGAQLHHACVVPGWTAGRGGSYDAIYSGDVFYNYVIAQDHPVGFDDHRQVAEGLAFWLAQDDPPVPRDVEGRPVWIDYDFHEACHRTAPGAAFHHPDLVLVLDDNAATTAVQGAAGTSAYPLATPFPPTRRVGAALCGAPPLAPPPGGWPVPPPAAPTCPLPAVPPGNPVPVVPVPALPH